MCKIDAYMKAKTAKVWTTLLATRPMWGMFPMRTIFGVTLFLGGLERFTVVRHHSTAIIDQIPGEWALTLIAVFAIVEIVGGILSVLGLAQRLVGLMIVVEMSLAIFLERVPLNFDRALSTQVLMFAIASMLLFSGAGRFSIDRYFARKLLLKFPNKKKELYCIAETPYTKWWE